MLRFQCIPITHSLTRVSVSLRTAQQFQVRGFAQSFVVRSNFRQASNGMVSDRSRWAAITSSAATVSHQVRFVRPRSKPGAKEDDASPREDTEKAGTAGSNKSTTDAENQQEKAAHEEGGGASSTSEESAKAGDKPKEEKPGFFRQLLGIKDDVTAFPEIYNAPNVMNMILFTIFCLASTGSSVEADWWVNQWGVDAAFRPWAWLLHSWMTNNFLSMSFAMMLVHSMAHSVVGTIGNRGLVTFCLVTSVVAGFMMWALNASLGNRSEKQFGPWDILSALFVMQYLHQGISPWAILSGFNGWVRYACYVGAVCILYYDWQPVACGTVLGFLLCRTRFRAAPVAGKTA